ncbi:hypothetical protein [Actinotignum sp. GS-2025b]
MKNAGDAPMSEVELEREAVQVPEIGLPALETLPASETEPVQKAEETP